MSTEASTAPGGPAAAPRPPATPVRQSLAGRAMAWAAGPAKAAAAPQAQAARGAAGAGSASAVRSFELAADEVISHQRRHRAQWITRVAALVVLALLVWASLAKVDEVTKGDAKVISSRQLQQVQSLDGGVISAIMVREGQVVEAGQVLLKIDETRATSGARENAAQGFALQARLARLRALAEGSEFKPPLHNGAEEQRIL
jgi:adhesin transport system membrane fusion protein